MDSSTKDKLLKNDNDVERGRPGKYISLKEMDDINNEDGANTTGYERLIDS